MYCNKCRNEINKDDLFCNKCGNKLETVKDNLKIDNQLNQKNNNNVVKLFIFISVCIIVLLLIMLFNRKPKNQNNYIPITTNKESSSNGNSKLSSSEANRLFEATVNYLKTSLSITSGNILNDGTYKCIETQGTKYIYMMNIKYNPYTNGGYIDTTKISVRTFYTFYDSSTDKFNVFYSLNDAKERMNQQ